MRSRAGLGAAVAACAALACVVLVAAGCSAGGGAKLASPWPRADSERAVQRPPVSPKWPLTGAVAPSESATKTRVVSVKIENSPQARPQTGLNSADVVYESVTEGGITRFNALFQSKSPAIVGPVRSARLSDMWIVPQYNALFYFSGASSTINHRVNTAGIENLSQDNGVNGPYFRSSVRSAPHNLYLRMAAARATAKQLKFPTSATVQPLKFQASVENTEAVRQITIPLSSFQTSRWVYQPGSKRYVRFNGSVRHMDAATGKQVSSRNVVVLWARYKPFSRDKVGSTTYDITLGGTGRAAIFRDGVKIDGTWEATRSAPPTFKSDSGQAIRLAPGNTWFEVIDTQTNIALK